MKRYRDLSFRYKLLIANLSIVLAVVVGITFLLTLTASNRATDSHKASLNLLTEQSLINYATRVDAIRQHLYAMSTSTGTPQQMAHLRGLDTGSNAYLQGRQELILALSRMVDSNAPYDHVSVKLDDGECISCNTYDIRAKNEAEGLLSEAVYAKNSYGSSVWVRTSSGSLFLIRDVYSTQPLKHVGRIAARIRQAPLVTLGQANDTLHCTLVFFDENGTLITQAGEYAEGTAEAAASVLKQPGAYTADGRYAACLYKQGVWQAVGLLPKAVVNEVQNSVIRSGCLIAVLGALFGLVVAVAFSHSLSRQLSRLVNSMNRVAAGDLDVVLPVESNDDIGILTRHFNDMTSKTRALLARVVREEKNKRRAEYQTLEYEYRFLQWQINPHFIYNALETVNGLAKLDGNDELCEIIMSLSAYFRQNAETMRQRFVPVRREFRSLKQYVDIYRHIYGDTFDAEFIIGEDAAGAYLPTMIVQPLLENALVHGMSTTHRSHIRISADKMNDSLVVCIRDDGSGMPQETIRQLLAPSADGPRTYEERTSLGVRNVLERMRLIYGSSASMHITSEPGAGTCVEMDLPLSYTDDVDALTAGSTHMEP